jgi:hypothetical protein
LGENTWRCPEGVGTQNQLQTWVPHPPSTHGRRREFDLDLKWEQRKFKKNQKNRKPAHGVMIYDIVPKKNIKHDIPMFQRKILRKNGTKQDFTWLSTQVTMVCANSIANIRILTPFLADMCISPRPTTFVTRVF